MTKPFSETMRMIKVEHSIFALPFALASAFIAAQGVPRWRVLALILVAMVTARSAAMAFNRFLDADVDALNPRTSDRSIPAGRLSRGYALGFTVAMSAAFVATTALLNPLTLMMAPFALLVLLGYSATKRFTDLSHLILGLALGLAPIGAWAAVRGTLALVPCLLGLAVLFWTAGFDMIYACQDIDFDRAHGLRSIPARLGIKGALTTARVLHVAVLAVLLVLGFRLDIHWIYWVGLAAVALCLAYEHRLVWRGDLSRVDMAFFLMNGAVSLVFGVVTMWAVLLRGF